jgi:hypothetical protein
MEGVEGCFRFIQKKRKKKGGKKDPLFCFLLYTIQMEGATLHTFHDPDFLGGFGIAIERTSGLLVDYAISNER